MHFFYKGLIGLPLLLFPLCVHWIDKDPYIWGLVITAVIETAAIYAVHLYFKNKQLREDLNRFQSVYIVGMHPVHNVPPAMERFAEYCEFVPNSEVDKSVRYWRKRLNDAGNRHDAKVVSFSFMEPVDEMAVNEHFTAEKGENNYPARICRGIEKDRQIVHCRQYNAGAKEYRGEVMGQQVEW